MNRHTESLVRHGGVEPLLIYMTTLMPTIRKNIEVTEFSFGPFLCVLKQSAKLEKAILKNMKSLGFELPVGGEK